MSYAATELGDPPSAYGGYPIDRLSQTSQTQDQLESGRFPSRQFSETASGIADILAVFIQQRLNELPPKLHSRVNEISALRDNWDGEGAKPVKPHVLADVLQLLQDLLARNPSVTPFIVPTHYGFIQLEWHGEKRSLEIESTETGWSLVGALKCSGGPPQYFDSECRKGDTTRLNGFLRWFLGMELIWPSL